jgi:hypothetical protein
MKYVSHDISLWVDKRNAYGKDEWVLWAKVTSNIKAHPKWAIHTWKTKPSEQKIIEAKEIVKRSLDFACRQMEPVSYMFDIA